MMFPPLPAEAGSTHVEFMDHRSMRSLSAWLSLPSDTAVAPAVILLHGCSGLGEAGAVFGIYRAWEELLNRAGFAVLAIDSAGSRGFTSTCGQRAERAVMLRERPGDAYAGLGYLQGVQGIDPSRIYLLGWSQGGGIALLTMNSESIGRPNPAPDHDFRAAVAFYPAACSSRLQSAPFTTVERGTWQTIGPILILQGDADNWTRAEPCEEFVEELQGRNQPVELVLYPNALHGFDAPSTPVHRRYGLTTNGGEAPLVGTNRVARDDAISRVLEFLSSN